MRGPKRSTYRRMCERFACSYCGAQPGRSCSKPSRPTPATSGVQPHNPRRRLLEAAQLAAFR